MDVSCDAETGSAAVAVLRMNSHAEVRMPKAASGSVIKRAEYAIRPGEKATKAAATRARFLDPGVAYSASR